MKPFFSILVPTYKRPALLGACVNSIKAQSFTDFEIIVGNNDPAIPLLDYSDPRIRIINRPANLGSLGNMMDLLSHANGRYITWLADDDLYVSKDFLKLAHECTESSPVGALPEVLFTGYQQGAEPSYRDHAATWRRMKPDEFLHAAITEKIGIIGNYGIWETEFIRKIGGMKRLGTGFSPYSDTLLGLEAAYAREIYYLPVPLVFSRTHSKSLSYTSEDLNAYATAQADMVKHYLKLSTDIGYYPTWSDDLYRLLRNWCLGFFFAVAARSKSPQLNVWPGYGRWLWSVSKNLPLHFRITLLGCVIFELVRFCWRRGFRCAGNGS